MVSYLPLEVRAHRPPVSPFTRWVSLTVSVPKALDTATSEERCLPDELKKRHVHAFVRKTAHGGECCGYYHTWPKAFGIQQTQTTPDHLPPIPAHHRP
jgi:hypothetical protein